MPLADLIEVDSGPEADGPAAEGGARAAGPRAGERRGEAERVHRWLGWALRAGHGQLGLTVDKGWARLDAVADAMRRGRPELALFDEPGLRSFLDRTDTEGRFEVDKLGRVRKVSR